jgi:hypothetical protein
MRVTQSIDLSRTSEPLVALEPPPSRRARPVEHISHDARVRVDRRVKQILDRRATAVKRARDAAQRLNRSDRVADGR